MPTLRTTTHPARSPRAQTGVDFVVGVAIFLLTTGFVFAFVPGMMTPFGESTTTPIHSDHVADDLVYDRLAADAAPATLDTEATLAFFDADATTVRKTLGLNDTVLAYNVSLVGEADDGGSRTPLYAVDGAVEDSGDTRLATGRDRPTSYGSAMTVSRHVWIDGRQAVLEVTLW